MNKVIVTALFATFCSFPVSADWSADVEILPEGKPAMQGRIFGKAQKLRYDMTLIGQLLSSIIDLKTKDAYVLVPLFRLATHEQANPAQLGAHCGVENEEACLKALGYKSVGKESIDGHACVIFEGDIEPGNGQRYHSRLWRPQDYREIPFLRSETRLQNSKLIKISLKKVKIEALAQGLFEVPKEYHVHEGFSPLAAMMGMGDRSQAKEKGTIGPKDPMKDLDPEKRKKAEEYLKIYRYSSYLDYVGTKRTENIVINKQALPKYFETPEDFKTSVSEWFRQGRTLTF